MKILPVGVTFLHADLRVDGCDVSSGRFSQLLCERSVKSLWIGTHLAVLLIKCAWYALQTNVKVVIYAKEFDSVCLPLLMKIWSLSVLRYISQNIFISYNISLTDNQIFADFLETVSVIRHKWWIISKIILR